jgi:putative transcriptional regulator
VSAIRLNRLLSAFVAIVTPAIFLNNASAIPEQTPSHASLAGQLLIASPSIGDPRFDRTVIVVVQHNQNGALGIVINLPMEERPLASLLQMLGEKDTNVAGKVRIFAGGPVQPQVSFVVHSADYHRPDTIAIDGRLAMTSSREILRDIGNNKGPKKILVALGYAGWGAGQLEGELQRRAWFTTPAEPTLVFDEDREKVWDSAFARRTQNL